ncbi:hypothetical protein H6G27_33720 [Nostoc linckia FACHB-104]|nr:hypothetical protein [Nostoc linckia FACHB-104]
MSEKIGVFSKYLFRSIVNVVSYALYPEGYGAACAAKQMIKANLGKDTKFHILDLGSGILTHTPYSNLNGVRQRNHLIGGEL